MDDDGRGVFGKVEAGSEARFGWGRRGGWTDGWMGVAAALRWPRKGV